MESSFEKAAISVLRDLPARIRAAEAARVREAQAARLREERARRLKEWKNKIHIFGFGITDLNYGYYTLLRRVKGTRSESKILTWWNQGKTMFSQDHDESRDLPARIREERKNKLRIFGFGIPDLDIGCWHSPRRLMEFSFEELEGLGEELASLNMEKITFHAETVSQDGVAVLDFHCSNVEYLIKEAERFYEAEFARVLCEAVAVTLGEKWARLGEEHARLEELERYFENRAKDCEAMKDIKIQIFESNTHEVDYVGLSHAIRCLCPSKDTRSESKIVAWWNQSKTIFSQDHDESHDYIKAVFDSSGKMTYQLCDPTMYEGKNFIVGKCKKTLQRVSSLLIAAIAFLWIISDICNQLSIFQLEQRRILSSLFKLFGFTVFVCALTTMVVVGAPFSRLQRTMLMFWAIMMLVRSAMSLTALYVSMLGILLMGRHVLLEKQPPHGG